MPNSFSSIPYFKPWKCSELQFRASSCRLLVNFFSAMALLNVCFQKFLYPNAWNSMMIWNNSITFYDDLGQSYYIQLSSHHSEEVNYSSSPSPQFWASLIVWFIGSFNKYLISAKPLPLPVFHHLSKWAYHSPWGWGVLAFIHLFSHTQVHQQVLPAPPSKYV